MGSIRFYLWQCAHSDPSMALLLHMTTAEVNALREIPYSLEFSAMLYEAGQFLD